jgi:hypothetical protein
LRIACDYDVLAAQLEKELAHLSTNSRLIAVHSGHNMELEAPEAVTTAIRQVVEAVRCDSKM